MSEIFGTLDMQDTGSISRRIRDLKVYNTQLTRMQKLMGVNKYYYSIKLEHQRKMNLIEAEISRNYLLELLKHQAPHKYDKITQRDIYTLQKKWNAAMTRTKFK